MLKAACDRVELAGGARHAGPAGQLGPGNDGPQQLRALGEAQGQQRAAEAVHQAEPRRRRRPRGCRRVAVDDVVGDVDEDLVGPAPASAAARCVIAFHFRRHVATVRANRDGDESLQSSVALAYDGDATAAARGRCSRPSGG